MQEYADPVIDWLDAGRGILPHRFFRDVRTPANGCTNSLHLPFTVMYTTAKWLIHQGPVSS